MSLSERLKQIEPHRTKRGCETCLWSAQLPQEDQDSITEWVTAGWSIRQLHRICAAEPENPLWISLTAFKNHVRDCLGIQ